MDDDAYGMHDVLKVSLNFNCYTQLPEVIPDTTTNPTPQTNEQINVGEREFKMCVKTLV